MNLKSLLSNINIGADYISLREVRSKKINLSVRNEIFEGLSESNDHGLMIEVMVNGHFGHAATQSFELSDVIACAQVAKKAAILNGQYSLFKFNPEVRPYTVGEYRSPAVESFESLKPKNIIALLMDLSKEMKIDPKIIDRNSNFSMQETENHFVATNGTDIKQQIVRTMLSMSVTASDENGSQRRTFGGDMGAQFGLERLKVNQLVSDAKKIADEALLLLAAPECPTETMDLILAPDQMLLQIHESIGHPLELDRILGDERNYAGWSFVKPTDFGTLQYGSKLMNITFDPTVVGQNASYFADDIGSVAKREFIIKEGKLLRGLGSLESQMRLNLPGVSSQRATSWNRAPIDRMANINLEPGNSSFNDIIRSVERGVFMRTTRSWSIDDYRNKFQFGCEYAELIENGEVKHIVKNPNYRGITTPFWNKLKMLGDKSTFEVGGLNNCGKGEPNQVISVGHASPVCLFGDVEVFGGGK